MVNGLKQETFYLWKNSARDGRLLRCSRDLDDAPPHTDQLMLHVLLQCSGFDAHIVSAFVGRWPHCGRHGRRLAGGNAARQPCGNSTPRMHQVATWCRICASAPAARCTHAMRRLSAMSAGSLADMACSCMVVSGKMRRAALAGPVRDVVRPMVPRVVDIIFVSYEHP